MTSAELDRRESRAASARPADSDAVVWQIEISPRPGQPDRPAARIAAAVREARWRGDLRIRALRGFLLQSVEAAEPLQRAAASILVDPVVEVYSFARCGDPEFEKPPDQTPRAIHVLLKPGVTDAEAESACAAIADAGADVAAVRSYRKYWVEGLADDDVRSLIKRFLANESIEQVVAGPLRLTHLDQGRDYTFQRIEVPLVGADDDGLLAISRQGQLSLTLQEMQAIQAYFRREGREPTDVELETIAQTWSEHCSHKTLAGPVVYRDERGTRRWDNLLKETIFAATQTIRRQRGEDDWCVSVFRDNAGVVRFDERDGIAFKVETHNRPSALEPYGGANTGVGGVIRDVLGTGLGARPIANTDVFCVAPPETDPSELPPGVLHPRRILAGIVAGVRDYGNRMGIPTVNGAVYFDRRYLGNPLVYCGCVGLLPLDQASKQPRAGDWIVTLGGRTGRDGIHGATFSSAELSDESEQISGGAVQIGHAIAEKMLADVLLQARDEGLFHAVTDCGAGGFSSAIGEMGAELGADVWLERAPLKYRGLSYTEIWISEAQERMILAVPPEHWLRLQALASAESVEATVIGRFEATGRLRLSYQSQRVGDLPMEFLHDGRPVIERAATYALPSTPPIDAPSLAAVDPQAALLRILSSGNVASKHWIIRQYDHEVQAGSAIKPLVGAANDGPSDAAVIRPRLDSYRGVVIACGMNPHYGDLDPYAMAAGAIDEAVRNCVAVGADPERIALLDNFSWGRTDRPEVLGSLVRAALACHDLAIELGTPFISGKDSLNNEFRYVDGDGTPQSIAIPPTLLISGLGQVDDVRRCVTSDWKGEGGLLYLIGRTEIELGGSHLSLVHGWSGGAVPQVAGAAARVIFARLHAAIRQGAVRACHDLSEGGLAVAAAEMAIAGRLGAEIDVAPVPLPEALDPRAADTVRLFSESNSRFLVEVDPTRRAVFESTLGDAPWTLLGRVQVTDSLVIRSGSRTLLACSIESLRHAWQSPLDWP